MDKLKSKAYAEARILVRNKILEMKQLSYKDLTEAQADQIESLINKKDSVVQEIAEKRYARSLSSLNEEFTKKFPADENKKKSRKKTPIIQLKKFEEESELNSQIFKAIAKKSEEHNVPLNVLGEVYNRGYKSYDSTKSVSAEQYAFARVNSFINEGKTYFNEDSDLATFDSLDESNNKPYVKPHHAYNDASVQVGWKASNKHGKVKYFGKDFEASAKKHAGITEDTVSLAEISQDTAKSYLLRRGRNADKPTYNVDYHSKIKQKYGSEDPEVKAYDTLEKTHAARIKSLNRAHNKAPGFDYEKELKNKTDLSSAMVKKYGNKYQTTPEGSGYVLGASHKPNHAILVVNTSSGSRSKNNDAYTERHVHVKHLKEFVELDEGKMKELHADLENLDNGNFKKKYGNHKEHFKLSLNAPVKEEVSDLDEAKSLAKGVNHLGKSVYDKRDGRTGTVQNSYTNGSHSIKWKGASSPTTHDWHETKLHIRIPSETGEHKKYIKESLQDIEEVSKTLMQRYLNKAGDSATDLVNKAAGHNSAADRLRKTGGNVKDIMQHDTAGFTAGKKADKRNAAMDKVEKKVNEESDLDEMSNDKLFDYSVKAADQASKIARPNKTYKKRLAGLAKASRHMQANRDKKQNESVELDAANREAGTTKLVKTYLSMTPGQEHADLGEDVNSADRTPVIVPAHRDAYGHTIPAKVVLRKSNRKIIRSGNVHDGEPDQDERR